MKRSLLGNDRGVTLTELMVAMVIITVGVVGSMGAFKFIAQAISASRIKSIATNLAQEKMEVLRNKGYFQLLVTTFSGTSSGYSPNFVYDKGSYPPDVITLWGMPALTRAVNVDYASVSGGAVTTVPYTDADTGMKKITVYVHWTERGTARKVQIDSYYQNPSVATLNTGYKGKVRDSVTLAYISGAVVSVIGIPKWRATTAGASDPNYTFQVSSGTYALQCSYAGYFSQSSAMLAVTGGVYTTKDFDLVRIASGTVNSASLYTLPSSLVISQVVASTAQADGFDAQYIELFNPTTGPINVGASIAAHSIKLNIKSTCGDAGDTRVCADVALTYVSTYVASGRYYLVANRSSFTVMGISHMADAYYTDTANTGCSDAPSDWLAPAVKRIIQAGHNGAVWLSNAANATLDAVGWNHLSQAAPSECEGSCIPFNGGAGTIGLLATDQIVRFSTPCAVGTTYGRAYDTDGNSNNFYYNNTAAAVGLSYRPFSSADSAQTVLSGRPSTGAYVFANDGNSAATQSSNGSVSGPQGQACTFSSFTLVGVATGTWKVVAVSGDRSQTISNIVVAQGISTSVTHGTTSPAWPAAGFNYTALTSTYTGGFAQGRVYGAGSAYSTPLSNILMGSSMGGTTIRTDSQGFYILSMSTGTATIGANYLSDNSNYLASETDVTITQGGVTAVPDFHLGQGGTIKGYVTSGTGAVPNISVNANNGGVNIQDSSDGTGYFYLFVSTSATAYTVTPDIDPLQSYTAAASAPCTGAINCTVTSPGSTVFAGTFTIVGAMGTITGSVKLSGSAITTGVLVVASTATVPDSLAAVYASSAPSIAIFYSVSSQSDGTYSLEVRSSTGSSTLANYNMRAFYPVVDIKTGAVSYTSKQLSPVATVSVNAGATVTGKDFTWP